MAAGGVAVRVVQSAALVVERDERSGDFLCITSSLRDRPMLELPSTVRSTPVVAKAKATKEAA